MGDRLRVSVEFNPMWDSQQPGGNDADHIVGKRFISSLPQWVQEAVNGVNAQEGLEQFDSNETQVVAVPYAPLMGYNLPDFIITVLLPNCPSTQYIEAVRRELERRIASFYSEPAAVQPTVRLHLDRAPDSCGFQLDRQGNHFVRPW